MTLEKRFQTNHVQIGIFYDKYTKIKFQLGLSPSKIIFFDKIELLLNHFQNSNIPQFLLRNSVYYVIINVITR